MSAKTHPGDPHGEILQINQKLLDAIMAGDWATYESLCDKDLTCLEPEAPGQVVQGLDFHKFYFVHGSFGQARKTQTTMSAPVVQICGDVAVIAYVRVVQIATAEGGFQSKLTAETRIWQKRDGAWKHIHFHRTPLAGG